MLASILGCLAGVIAFLSLAIIGVLHARSAATVGHLIRFDEEKSQDGRYFRAIFAYEVDGGRFEVRSLEGYSEPKQPIGSEVKIRYSLDRHEWAAEDRLWAIYFVPILTGAFACAMSGWHWFLRRRISKEQGPNKTPQTTPGLRPSVSEL